MKQPTSIAPGTVQITTLEILGVSCDTCVRDVTASLNALEGVVHVQVDLERNTAVVEHLPSYADESALVAAVRRAGYPARVERIIEESVPASAGGSCCGCCVPRQS